MGSLNCSAQGRERRVLELLRWSQLLRLESPRVGVPILSWRSVHERACLSSAFHFARDSISSFAEVSLKLLLTPYTWTNTTIFCIYMQKIKAICKNM
jgi:hypothetical protein